MSPGNEFLSLENLGRGAAVELFETKLQHVIDNILDPNTGPTAVREVTLKVKFKPNKDRDHVAVEVHAVEKLAPVNPFETHIYVGKKSGQAVATEHNPTQMRVFDQPPAPEAENVIPMTAKKEG